MTQNPVQNLFHFEPAPVSVPRAVPEPLSLHLRASGTGRREYDLVPWTRPTWTVLDSVAVVSEVAAIGLEGGDKAQYVKSSTGRKWRRVVAIGKPGSALKLSPQPALLFLATVGALKAWIVQQSVLQMAGPVVLPSPSPPQPALLPHERIPLQLMVGPYLFHFDADSFRTLQPNTMTSRKRLTSFLVVHPRYQGFLREPFQSQFALGGMQSPSRLPLPRGTTTYHACLVECGRRCSVGEVSRLGPAEIRALSSERAIVRWSLSSRVIPIARWGYLQYAKKRKARWAPLDAIRRIRTVDSRGGVGLRGGRW